MSASNNEKDKVFFYLKLHKDFFKRHDIKILMSTPSGNEKTIFYLQLICESIDHKGELRFNDVIPYNEEMLSIITGMPLPIVRSALETLIQMQLIEVWDNETYYVKNIEKMMANESYWATRKRIQRIKNKEKTELLDNVQHMSPESPAILEIEKEIEIEINNNTPVLKKRDEKNYLIFDFWNTKEIIKHTKLTATIEKAIAFALKSFDVTEINTAIENYSKVLKDNDYYFKYKWTLENFLKQKNAISQFTNDGQAYLNYLEFKSKKPNNNFYKNQKVEKVKPEWYDAYVETSNKKMTEKEKMKEFEAQKTSLDDLANFFGSKN